MKITIEPVAGGYIIKVMNGEAAKPPVPLTEAQSKSIFNNINPFKIRKKRNKKIIPHTFGYHGPWEKDKKKKTKRKRKKK